MPRKVKVTNIEQDREEPVEVDATAEPEEYGQVVKDLKAEDSGEIEGLEDFVIPPAGYEAPSDKVTGKERAKKPRAKKAASAPATVIEAIEELKDDEPEVVEEPVKKVPTTRKKKQSRRACRGADCGIKGGAGSASPGRCRESQECRREGYR